jgi:ACS family D-galactonate transporter-like MFS transporter
LSGVTRYWLVLLLLVASGLLNYADRANLSVGATDIQRELHLSNYQLGLLLSAFFWTYALAQLCYVAGWLVDRLHVCLVLACGVALWSAATTATGLVGSFAVLFSLRLLLGTGESVAYPSYSRILVSCFPEHRRGLSNAAIDAGTKLGPAIGALLGGLLIPAFGWRVFFLALGIAGLMWVVPWLVFMPRGKKVSSTKDPDSADFARILCCPKVWVTAVGLFCSNYFWYFLITWLPPYLEQERNFPKAKMAVASSASFLAIALSALISGWLSDHLILRGSTATLVRKSFAGCGLIFSTLLLPVAMIDNVNLAMALLMGACVAFGMYTGNVYAITQTLAGPAAAGRWTSIQNGVGNLAGVAAPWFTGWVVDRTGHFFPAFLAAVCLVLAAAALFTIAIGNLEPVDFQAERVLSS